MSEIWVKDPLGYEFTESLHFYKHPKNPSPEKVWLSDVFWQAWIEMCRGLLIDPIELMLVSLSESRLEPWAKNPDGAFGLFQFTEPARGLAGISTNTELWNFHLLSAERQMPYISKFWTGMSQKFRGGQGFPGFKAQAFYAYNAAPSRVGDGNDRNVLYDSKIDPAGYNGNRTLDIGHKGRITIGDLRWITDALRKSKCFAFASQQIQDISTSVVNPQSVAYKWVPTEHQKVPSFEELGYRLIVLVMNKQVPPPQA